MAVGTSSMTTALPTSMIQDQYPISATSTTSSSMRVPAPVTSNQRWNLEALLHTGSAPKPRLAATTRISTHHPVPSAHVLNLPPISNPFATLPIPQLKPSPVNPGYNEAHKYYDEMRQYYASKAYTSAATAELVVVKVRMVTLEPGRKKPTLVSVSSAFFRTVS